MNTTQTPVRYEFSPRTGLTIQRRDGDAIDCEVAGYGPGASLDAAREYVANAGGVLVEFAYPATE